MNTQPKKILLLGSGGREHAISWKLEQNPEGPVVVCAPGNGGIRMDRRRKVDIDDENVFRKLLDDEQPDLVIFGPEAHPIKGYGDLVRAKGILAFGPDANAAIIEGSKAWMKEFCTRNDLPTAPYKIARDRNSAFDAIDSFEELPVIKADGPCAGKGVILPESMAHAYATIDVMLSGEAFGDAGKTIVIEKRISGVEYSMMAFTDGTDIAVLPVARDHKRAFDGDKGPNTGGMGAIAPIPGMDRELFAEMEHIVLRAVRALKAEGREYRGVLFAGFMVEETEDGWNIYLLEFNCRFGDPETQVVLPLVESDLLPYFLACAKGEGLKKLGPLKVSDRFAVGVILASEGYPGPYEKGLQITDSGSDLENTLLFHAGTEPGRMGMLVTNGGRVAAAIGLGNTVEEAHDNAYLRDSVVFFANKFRRMDIPRL